MAERTKIVLSSAPCHRAELDFVESGLAVQTSGDDFDVAIESFLAQLERTLTSVRGDLVEPPASVFLTGGTSRSAQIKACVQASFPQIPLVQGDPSLGVVSGLAVVASEVSG